MFPRERLCFSLERFRSQTPGVGSQFNYLISSVPTFLSRSDRTSVDIGFGQILSFFDFKLYRNLLPMKINDLRRRNPRVSQMLGQYCYLIFNNTLASSRSDHGNVPARIRGSDRLFTSGAKCFRQRSYEDPPMLLFCPRQFNGPAGGI